MKTIHASLTHLGIVAKLFNDYRVFNKQPSDLYAAEQFIKQRLIRKDSFILLAVNEKENQVYGFAQIYPTFSSVRLANIHTLNDLFVDPSYRKQGVARSLLEATKANALENHIHEISLEAAADNVSARRLYESAGYKQINSEYLTYRLTLSNLEAKEKYTETAAHLRQTKNSKDFLLIV